MRSQQDASRRIVWPTVQQRYHQCRQQLTTIRIALFSRSVSSVLGFTTVFHGRHQRFCKDDVGVHNIEVLSLCERLLFAALQHAWTGTLGHDHHFCSSGLCGQRAFSGRSLDGICNAPLTRSWGMWNRRIMAFVAILAQVPSVDTRQPCRPFVGIGVVTTYRARWKWRRGTWADTYGSGGR